MPEQTDTPDSFNTRCIHCKSRFGIPASITTFDPSVIRSQAFRDLENNNELPRNPSFLEADFRTAISYLAVLDSKIHECQKDLQNLLKERERIDEISRHYRTVLNPVRRIPREVLMEIFRHFVGFDEEKLEQERPPKSLDTKQGPWVIGKVCKEWRATINTESSLWRFVGMDLDSLSRISKKELSRLEYLLITQLNRSKFQPLHLYLTMEQAEPSFDHPILACLLSHCSRWTSLRIRAPYRVFQSTFSFISGNLFSLKLLMLAVVGQSHQWQLSELPPDLSIAFPNRACALETVHVFTPSIVKFVLPWSTVKNIIFRDRAESPEGIEDILRNACSLRACEIDYSYSEPLPQHLSLATLSVLCLHGSGTHHLFDSLTLPNLRALSIRVPFLHGWIDHFQSFVQRSECNLDTLSLRHNYFDKDPLENEERMRATLVKVLQTSPSVRTLFFETGVDSIIQSVLFEMYRWAHTLLPNLNHFGYSFSGLSLRPRLDHLDDVFDMTQSRLVTQSHPSSSTRRVIYIPPGLDPKGPDRLRDNRAYYFGRDDPERLQQARMRLEELRASKECTILFQPDPISTGRFLEYCQTRYD
ncbi:hypothetical protein K435DRAFT_878147 [Dendrothele bispora CBS 962.96]|uniref:F-box domain-containing protein n=1 Tax=Dendrothele bispora (strain CBS 962.96) TaxID=1314807 RepID=A0A4S8KNR7_DENBC|nr:hypothetical protein K435DRAFT_878147 [Dendrothele bispora CBS 962.96]